MRFVFLVLLLLVSIQLANAAIWEQCIENDPRCTKFNMVCGIAIEGGNQKHCLSKCETDEQCSVYRKCVSGGCQYKLKQQTNSDSLE